MDGGVTSCLYNLGQTFECINCPKDTHTYISYILCLINPIQEQYIFLHNALDEYFKCGNTSYPCNNFLETFGTISTPSDDLGGISELDRQYNVKYKL